MVGLFVNEGATVGVSVGTRVRVAVGKSVGVLVGSVVAVGVFVLVGVGGTSVRVEVSVGVKVGVGGTGVGVTRHPANIIDKANRIAKRIIFCLLFLKVFAGISAAKFLRLCRR